jgi:hypothetical protein
VVQLSPMNLQRAHGYPVPESNHGLDRQAQRDLVAAYQNDERLPVELVEPFLSMHFNGGRDRVGPVVDGVITGGLVTGQMVGEAYVEHHPDSLPNIGTMHELVRDVLNNGYELYPFGSERVNSLELAHHAPQLMLGVATAYPVVQVFRRWRQHSEQRGFNRAAEHAQSAIAEDYEAGRIRWQIAEGATVALVGGGDPLANELADLRGDRAFMPISYEPLDRPWTHVPRGARQQEVNDALDRADISRAGELLLFPIKPTEEFLPGPEGHDMRIDDMTRWIVAVDELRDAEGVGMVPVTIIGDTRQQETYRHTQQGPHHGESRRETLVDRAQWLQDRRGEAVRVIDPSEIMAARLREIADGHPLNLAGSDGSMREYADRFYGLMGPQYGDSDHALTVYYGRSDNSTAALVAQDPDHSIAVVLDPAMRDALCSDTYSPIPPERVLVVAEEVLRVMTAES